MRMLFKLFVYTFTINVILFSYLVYHPLPEMEDGWRAQCNLGAYKLLRTMLTWYGQVTRESYIVVFQKFYASVLEKSERPLDRDPNVTVTRDSMVGVPVVVYRPKTSSSEHRPAMVYFHGGGFGMGSAASADPLVRNYIKRLDGFIIVSVEYRLSPAHIFPAAYDDALSVTKYILAEGQDLGVDTSRVGVAGDSAGANLASSVAYALLQDRSLPPLRFQILHFPFLQGLNFNLASHMQESFSTSILDRDMMAEFMASYLGLDPIENSELIKRNRHVSPQVLKKYADFFDESRIPEQYRLAKPGTEKTLPDDWNRDVAEKIENILVDPRLSPFFVSDLSGLPPTFVHISEVDILRDEGFLFASRLKEFGVQTNIYVSKGYHGEVMRMIPLDFMESVTGFKATVASSIFIKDVLN